MKTITSVFSRVFVVEFYRINAGFFFVFIAVCFGFLSGREHLALAQAFVSSPILLLIPVFVWVAYTFKVIGFNHLIFQKKESGFLYPSVTLPRLLLWRNLVSVAIGQLAPMLAYGAFLSITAIRVHQFNILFVILLVLILLSLFITWQLYRELAHPGQEKSIGLLKHKLDTLMTKPLIWFYPEWIVRHQPIAVIGIKLFSCLIIIGVSRLYLFDTYDERLMAMGCTIAFAFNTMLAFFYHRFENFHFAMLRSLPLTTSRRLLSFVAAMLLLNIPEIGILINYFPTSLSFLHLISIVIYGLSIYLASYALLFLQDLSIEKFINPLFATTLMAIVLILFKVPVIVLAAALTTIAVIVYRKKFYEFEFQADEPAEK